MSGLGLGTQQPLTLSTLTSNIKLDVGVSCLEFLHLGTVSSHCRQVSLAKATLTLNANLSKRSLATYMKMGTSLKPIYHRHVGFQVPDVSENSQYGCHYLPSHLSDTFLTLLLPLSSPGSRVLMNLNRHFMFLKQCVVTQGRKGLFCLTAAGESCGRMRQLVTL